MENGKDLFFILCFPLSTLHSPLSYDMNRIEEKFKKLKSEQRAAFIPYITAGDPSIEVTKKLFIALEESGADIIELGVPFSDPIADGPTVQKASERALKTGINLKSILELVKDLRQRSELPIALLTYYNTLLKYGIEAFSADAVEAGVDGVIVADLPPEEAEPIIEAAKKCDLATIFLVAPTSTPERMALIASVSSGFIYCVSVTGVTGARSSLSEYIYPMIAELRKHTDKPIGVGFGVSNTEQAKHVARLADAVIVGSAIINVIERNLNSQDWIVAEVKSFAKSLAAAIRQARMHLSI
jgi:tryptophan synthase alpha chain